jgi:hypothetical protein
LTVDKSRETKSANGIASGPTKDVRFGGTVELEAWLARKKARRCIYFARRRDFLDP